MPNCSAIGCTNRSTDHNCDKSFHRLPADDEFSDTWLKNIKRKGAEDLGTLRICSDHFEKECFERDLKSELMGTKKKSKLKPGSVPTIFVFSRSTEKRKSTEKRLLESSKKQLISQACDTIPEERFQLSPISASTSSCNETPETCVDNNASAKIHIETKNQGTQTRRSNTLTNVSVNTDISFSPNLQLTNHSFSQTRETPSVDEGVSDENVSEHEFDVSYSISSQQSQTESDSSISTDDSSPIHVSSNPLEDTKFIVFWSALMPLFQFCFTCKSSAYIKKIYYKGYALVVTMFCISNHETTWCSQPIINDMFAANLLIPASILFTGGTFTQFKEICDAFGLKSMGKTLYHRIQNKYLFPCIHKIYKTFQAVIIDKVKERGAVNVIGDARCDSPGYNAKYSTYSLMDSITGQVMHFHVVHVGTVENSSRMEKEGLIKVLDKVKAWGISIRSLTTDRHPQVMKYIRENQSEIIHQFDIWHFSKSIKKALVKAAKKKFCDIINKWIKSIINHFWWSCSSCCRDFDRLKETWISVLFHISNKHEWIGYDHFKMCEHRKLTKKQRKKKKWIKEGTRAFFEIEKVVKDKRRLNDLRHCTEFRHSGNLEVYHSLYLKYCPKRIHFSTEAMIARAQLAVMHFNATVLSPQAKTRVGKLKFKQQYSKVSNSWVIKKIKEPGEKTYLVELMRELVWLRESNEEVCRPDLQNIPTYIAPVEKPDKEDSIMAMRTRFL